MNSDPFPVRLRDAVALAQRLRSTRDRAVQSIRSGDLPLGAVDRAAGLAADDVDQVKIVVLAEAVPGLGKMGARQVLDTLGIPHGTRWGELGPRKAKIIAALTSSRSDGASPTFEQ